MTGAPDGADEGQTMPESTRRKDKTEQTIVTTGRKRRAKDHTYHTAPKLITMQTKGRSASRARVEGGPDVR